MLRKPGQQRRFRFLGDQDKLNRTGTEPLHKPIPPVDLLWVARHKWKEHQHGGLAEDVRRTPWRRALRVQHLRNLNVWRIVDGLETHCDQPKSSRSFLAHKGLVLVGYWVV